jgi:hypothetical protein
LKPSDFVRELLLPATSPTVFLALLMFFGLFQIAILGRSFGLAIALILAAQLLIFVLPALQRTLMRLLKARSLGREPEPPTIESFSWVGDVWMLFPIVHAGVIAYLYVLGADRLGVAATSGIVAAYACFLPASLVLLGVTQSALESINPRAIVFLLRQCGVGYLPGPLFLVASVAVVIWLENHVGHDVLTGSVGFYLLFASFAVFGGMVRPLQLQQHIEVSDPEHLRAEEFTAQRALVRDATLNHAYGLISRGNRSAGLEHVYAELARDPDPAGGWYWYFDRLMRWENNTAGLAFAQQYTHELLQNGDCVAAVKVMLRCQRVNPAFKPHADDLPEAVAAAEACHNDELARALQS